MIDFTRTPAAEHYRERLHLAQQTLDSAKLDRAAAAHALEAHLPKVRCLSTQYRGEWYVCAVQRCCVLPGQGWIEALIGSEVVVFWYDTSGEWSNYKGTLVFDQGWSPADVAPEPERSEGAP
jgi:hypothetical protein